VKSIDYRRFSREGDNLVYHLPVSYPEAVLGSSLTVPDPAGEEDITVKIPDSSRSGDRVAVKGRGLGRLDRRGRGDLLVQIEIHVPGRAGRREKKLLEEMASMEAFRPTGR
jgi:molecular chaperone DnaJ